MSRIRVLLVEDGTTAHNGVAALRNHDGIDIVASSNENAAVQLAADLKPDVAVLDCDNPTSASTVARFRDEAPTVRVVVRSPQEDRAALRHILECGARGYVVKRDVGDSLAEAVQAVATGRTYIDPALGNITATGTGQPLSAREDQVLRLLSLGHVNKEVAAALDVSVKTVETHKFRGMAKLGLHSRVDLVRYAHQHGWFDHI